MRWKSGRQLRDLTKKAYLKKGGMIKYVKEVKLVSSKTSIFRHLRKAFPYSRSLTRQNTIQAKVKFAILL